MSVAITRDSSILGNRVDEMGRETVVVFTG